MNKDAVFEQVNILWMKMQTKVEIFMLQMNFI